jgi:ATP-dependent Clp protease protease subunit
MPEKGKGPSGVSWIEKSERLYDYYVASHRERLEYGELWLNGDIDKAFIETGVMRLITLANSGHFERVNVFINSSGGDVDEGFAFIDFLLTCPVPVWTINIGEAASMGLSVFLAGERRFALPHSNFMAHSVSYDKGNGKLMEQESYLSHVKLKQTQLATYYASRSKKTVKWWLSKYKEADFYFDAIEGVKLGIVTDIIETREAYEEVFSGVVKRGEKKK